jgi:DNA polymerase-4
MIACFLIPTFGIVCERERKAELVSKPIALTGEDGALQIVSEEAELYGIRTGQSASAARALCPSILLLPYCGEYYTEAARVIWDLLAIESSVVEPVSPELCFVEMSGRDIPDRVRSVALEIARQVRCPVQAGIASSKLVARQAALKAQEMGFSGR